MRGYTERMEFLQQFADEGSVIGYDEVMDSILEQADAVRDEADNG